MKKCILKLDLYLSEKWYCLRAQNWEYHENLLSYSCKSDKDKIIEELQKEISFTKDYINWKIK